jgi:glycosyltransferase involved in cell wall biosynthesis
MPGISIALATFNGEKYLAAQLESLAAQVRPPAELIVSDDASDDGTVDIVRAFAKRSPFPVRLLRNETRLGFRDNFMRAVAQCGADLIAFCDQDDIWEPEKLAVMEPAFQDRDVLLAYHNATLIDAGGRVIGRLYKDGAAGARFPPLTRHPWLVVPGFTQIFRRELMRFSFLHSASRDVDWPQETLTHDRWFFFFASVLGHIVFVGQPLARYRQHSGSTFGLYPDWRAHLERLFRGERFVRAAAAAARNRSELLQQIQGQLTAEWEERTRQGIAYYDALERRLAGRTEIYASRKYWTRAKTLNRLWYRQRAYSKAHGSARFGWADLLMDTYLAVPFGPRLQRLLQWFLSEQSPPPHMRRPDKD